MPRGPEIALWKRHVVIFNVVHVGMKQSEVAKQLNISPKAVEWLVKRSKARCPENADLDALMKAVVVQPRAGRPKRERPESTSPGTSKAGARGKGKRGKQQTSTSLSATQDVAPANGSGISETPNPGYEVCAPHANYSESHSTGVQARHDPYITGTRPAPLDDGPIQEMRDRF